MSPKPPILSRIVTSYNQWRYVERWLGNEALHQPGVEWIVVNDTPEIPAPDSVTALCQRFGVQIITPSFNMGRSNARNLGARAASGLWLDFIDGDDFPHVVPIEAFTEADGEIGAFPVVGYRSDSVLDPEQPPEVDLPWHCDAVFQDILFPEYMPIDYRPCGVAIRREAFAHIGGFDARFEEGGEDYQLVWNAAQHGLKLSRFQFVKQSYLAEPYTGKTTRITELSTSNLFGLLARYGTPALRQTYQEHKICSLQVTLWQTLAMLKQQSQLPLIFRLKLIIKLLLNRF
ncbi:MAG: glycosyltransferase family 2 protein [Puniceicoccales bacterium]